MNPTFQALTGRKQSVTQSLGCLGDIAQPHNDEVRRARYRQQHRPLLRQTVRTVFVPPMTVEVPPRPTNYASRVLSRVGLTPDAVRKISAAISH